MYEIEALERDAIVVYLKHVTQGIQVLRVLPHPYCVCVCVYRLQRVKHMGVCSVCIPLMN